MRIWFLFVVALCGLLTKSAYAQRTPSNAATEEFFAARFSPAVGSGNYLMVDGALVAGHLTPSALFLVDYANQPFVIFKATCENADNDSCELDGYDPIVRYQVTGTIGGALTLLDLFQVGLTIPVVGTSVNGYHASRGQPESRPVRVLGGEAFSLSDPRLTLKAQILGQSGKGPMLAAVVYGTAPLGRTLASGRGLGYDGITAGGHLVAEYRNEAFQIALNLGGVWRPRSVLLSTETGSEMTFAAAGSVPLTALLSLGVEATGTTRLSGILDENSLEARGYGRLKFGDIHFQLGVGAGLGGGAGTPNFRVLAGLRFSPQSLDSDGDGVRDVDDRCPGAVEDMDGYLDDDGCPEVDNDADGLPDGSDQCPDDPEDMDGKDDGDGCPDLDNDGDGIQDGYDSCPEEAEDMDGDRDDDGCPDHDRDRDGIDDDADQCPEDPEDTDGFADEDGCPEADFDGDGLPDDEDECPAQPEDLDGVQDEDGCPEEGDAPSDSTDDGEADGNYMEFSLEPE